MIFQAASIKAGATASPAEPVEEKKPEAHTNAAEQRGQYILISMDLALLFWLPGTQLDIANQDKSSKGLEHV